MLRAILRIILLTSLFATNTMAASDAKKEWEDMHKAGGALGRITLLVVDDQGNPVVGANVLAGFFSTPEPTRRQGVTNLEGIFTCEGRSIDDVNFKIEKEGYYDTGKPYRFIDRAPSTEDAIKSGKWIPWNPTVTMILKKIRNPVPMYAKEMSIPLPCDQSVGFDLEAQDLVAPLGKGVVPDVIFHVKSTVEFGREGWSCAFSNAPDGIQVLEMDRWSDFPWVYKAPAEGYLNEFGPFEKPREEYRHPEDVRSFYYVFRVRTKTDAKGRIASAKYGKMHTGIRSVESKKNGCKVVFQYWYNPDGTQNLEFDPKRNLGKSWRGWDRQINQP